MAIITSARDHRPRVAEALRRLASDASLRERLGAEARARAAEFTPERWAAATADAYERLLAP